MIASIKKHKLAAVFLLILGSGIIFLSIELCIILIASTSDKKIDFAMLVITVAAAIYTLSANKTRDINARQFNEKKIAYQAFISFLLEIVQDVKNKKARKYESDKKFIKRVWALKQQILIFSSQEFIDAFVNITEYNRTAGEGGTEGKNLDRLALLEAAVSSMREDLGHDDDLEYPFYAKLFLIPDEEKKDES